MPPTALRNIKHSRQTRQRSKPLEDTDDDFMRPPSYSSSSEDSPGDIQPSVFNRNSQKDETRIREAKVDVKGQMASSQASSSYGGVNSYRLRRRLDISSQVHNSRTSKSSDISELPELPRQSFSYATEKRIPGKKTYRAVYGKMNQSSSQSTAFSQPNSSQTSQCKCLKISRHSFIESNTSILTNRILASPKKKLKCIKLPSSDSDDSEDQIYATFKPPNSEFKPPSIYSDESNDEITMAFKPPSDEFLDSSCFGNLEAKSPTKVIKAPTYSSYYSSPVSKRKNISSPFNAIFKNETSIPKFKIPKTYHETPPSSLSDPCSSFGQKSAKESSDENAKVNFKEYSDLEPFSSPANAIPLSFTNENPNFKTENSPVTSRCPMCYEPVSPNDLRSQGHMNTRRQEKFCLEHRKKSARKRWEINRYPHIDWDSLDTRISKHHKFLQQLINGKESYYRSLLQDKIDQGKDRNLRTTTTNLIPGYYGPRGLRTISENLFRKFTPLLKKRIVQDRLIAARGYTPYVQSVLVPEVAALLIQEDMQIALSEARDVMAESAVIGELLHEEVREDLISPTHNKQLSLEED
ncbi:hypothetical protein OnM2_027041 [Erysiphe neolycopersici]|uniref:Restriction of telomere capping protein 4 n=1 Tax=Erysiphe neolycopersici TaxID=212602 RepID=A0A420I0E3_9PEZI|nr:hypothetical protein OnM2_027041 [Erysiphe neolycopersici]